MGSGLPAALVLALACSPEPAPGPVPGPASAPAALPVPPATPVVEAPAVVPPFSSSTRPLSAEEQASMRGVSWREGCPVPLEALVRVEVSHHRPDESVGVGVIVVSREAEAVVVGAFERLYVVGFPIARMEPIEGFGGDDDASMEANNTSGFNCRDRFGGGSFSRHAYGDAVDINPLWNPLVKERTGAQDGVKVAPEGGRPWRDRTRSEAGMLHPGSEAVRAFTSQGWGWGGSWRSSKDWQHFSANGE